MITNIRLFHAKKMHTSGVPPAPMTWLVFTLLLASVVYFCLLPSIFCPSIHGTYLDDDELADDLHFVYATHTNVLQAAAAETTVKVITTPVFAQIPRLQASKDFQVLVRVEAPPAVQQQRRVPIDLAVVLDVGSGGGTTGTARLDSVKKAVKFIIRQIHDDDRLAVVGPSSICRRLLGDEATGFLNARRNAEKFVDELEPRGEVRSRAGAGLEEAIKILRELPATARASSRTRFVILLTDAATTEDSSRVSKLRRELLPPVHTFGIGAAYDPRALLSIARESQGTYSFVDDENADGITGAMAICLSGLKDVVAVGTRVRLEAPSGITIEKIQSGGYRTSPNTRDDMTSGEVAVGVLYAGEVKSFLVHLSVPALPSTSTMTSIDDNEGCYKQRLLSVTFVGHYTTSDEEEDAAAPAAILYVQRPPPEAIDSTLQRVPVPVVMNHIARFGALEMVTTFVDNEIRPLSSSSDTVELATRLRSQWEEFVQARQFWSGLDLGVLDVEINRMVSMLSSTTSSLSSATAYMLSWVSSYQMQRPMAMGSPANVAAAFVTVNMQLTLQQATTIVTAPLCISGDGDDGGCPACEDRCVQPLPPPVFVPSGRDDGTFRVNAVYPQGELFSAINQAMKQMYLALVQASNLTRCDGAAAGVVVLPA